MRAADGRFAYLKWPGGHPPVASLGSLRAKAYKKGIVSSTVLLDLAADDLTAAVLLCSNELGAQASFMGAQAAEKALKSLILGAQGTPLRVHSLTRLARVVRDHEPMADATDDYLAESLLDIANELERCVGSSNTLTRYPDYTLKMLDNPYSDHPVVAFGEWTVYQVLEAAATIFDWCLFCHRLRGTIGYEARQRCIDCSGEWRPVYCCVHCFRWICEEHSLLTHVSVTTTPTERQDRICDDCFAFLGGPA